MKIGIFDSGLGGLAIASTIMRRLPKYDFVYLGDTKRAPYGVRSQETIHEFTGQALSFLFEANCQLVILACNTASAESLRKSQQDYLPHRYPERRVLGVTIPTAEAAVDALSGSGTFGVLATPSTVESNAYCRELARLRPDAQVVQRAAPLLVPMIENDGIKYIEPVLADYLAAFEGIGALILGCTHYCLLKDKVRARIHSPVISPDEIVPEKLADYLQRHPEIETKLSKDEKRRYCVTELTTCYQTFAKTLVQDELDFEVVGL